jgi:hypothetical protein
MRKLALLAGLALLGMGSANADVINNLSIGTLLSPVPQSQSNPCIICATNASQPTIDAVTFGYNNFTSNGNTSSYNMFSDAVVGNVADGVQGTAYTRGFLVDALAFFGDVNLTFGVAIDVNTATGGETLQTFQLIDLSKPAGQRIIFDIDGPIALPDTNNGNGKGDYLITGFDLSGIDNGDLLIFRAMWTNASDGGESFYLVPILSAVSETPLPSAIWMFGGAIAAFSLVTRNRRKQKSAWDIKAIAA